MIIVILKIYFLSCVKNQFQRKLTLNFSEINKKQKNVIKALPNLPNFLNLKLASRELVLIKLSNGKTTVNKTYNRWDCNIRFLLKFCTAHTTFTLC